MQVMLGQHKLDIQRKIESMSSGSEILLRDLYKPYEKMYPVHLVYEQVQTVAKLNLRRFRIFKRDNLLLTIISRLEDYV